VTAETSCCHDATEDAFLYTHKAIWLYTPRPQDNSADKPVILGKAQQDVPAYHTSDVITDQLATVTAPFGVPAERRS
jgi:hypothetical protein